MKSISEKICIKTQEKFQFKDITSLIRAFIEIYCWQEDGIINISSLHTTTAIIINENEPLLLNDLLKTIKEIIPDSQTFEHDNLSLRKEMNPDLPENECKNGDAHCRAVFLPTSVTLNITDGKLCLGKWQSIFFLELDSAKEREISVVLLK